MAEIKDILQQGVQKTQEQEPVINKEEYLDNIKETLKNVVPKETFDNETKRLREDNVRLSGIVNDLVQGKKTEADDKPERTYEEIYKEFRSGTQLKPLSDMKMMSLVVETAEKAKRDYDADIVSPQLVEDIKEALDLSNGDKSLFNGYMKSKYPGTSFNKTKISARR